jgi:predicted nucleic acid-binding protein
MAFYIDTNVFVYAIENHPKYGKSCAKILSDLHEKRIQGSSSVLVLVELINVLAKLNKILKTKQESQLVISDNIAAVLSLPIIWIDLDIRIIETASTYDYQVNGVDYVHIASMDANSISEVLSADHELDKVKSVTRIDPLDYK